MSSVAELRRQSDAALVQLCRSGDSRAWERLVERFSRYVHAIAVNGFRLSPADAEEVFQEVFMRVYEHLGELRDEDAVRPWVAQLTRRAALDLLRSRARIELRASAAEPVTAEDPFARVDDVLAVRSALAAVPAPAREVVDRFYCRDQSYRTISAEMKLPSGTVASRIARSLPRLRDELEGPQPEREAAVVA